MLHAAEVTVQPSSCKITVMVVSLQVVIFVGVSALASTVSSVSEFILTIAIKTYHVNKRRVLLFCLRSCSVSTNRLSLCLKQNRPEQVHLYLHKLESQPLQMIRVSFFGPTGGLLLGESL